MNRFVLAISLAFACLCVLSGARAAEDLFTVSNIPVDATAASASVAQNMAINGGRGKAWTTLYRRLTKQQDWSHQPVLDDASLQRLVSNYVLTNERRSTTRFVANVSYIFNPDAVRRLLRSQSLSFVDLEAKPILIVPMAPNYQGHSPWANSWANPRLSAGAAPLLLPVGDAIDSQALGALNFASAQWQDVEPAASRVHASEAFLVQATAGKGNVTVALRRLGAGASSPIPNVVVPVHPGEPAPQAYSAAADATAAAIIDVWKSHSAVDFGKRFKLTASAHISSLSDWGALMQKLSAIPTVTDVSVTAMNIGEARVAITYVGSSDQLQSLAEQADVSLTNSSGTWQLSLGAQAPQSAQAPQ